MALPHRRAKAALEDGVALAEPPVAEPVWMGATILFPKKSQSDAAPAQLFFHPCPVGNRTGRRRHGGRWRERRIKGDLSLREIFARPLYLAEREREQRQKQRGKKVYSLHAPEVECIGKGSGRPGTSA